MVSILIVGGTFNPVHYGHLFLAEAIRSQLAYDDVVFIPTNIPVHKSAAHLVDARHRIEMLRIAAEPYETLLVEDCEVRRGDLSYSIDTVRYLIGSYRLNSKPGFVIGDDLVDGFHAWKEAERLASSVDLIVAHRRYTRKLPFEYAHRYIDNPIFSVSSSEIRRRLSAGRSVRFLLPDSVVAYMEEHGLYRR